VADTEEFSGCSSFTCTNASCTWFEPKK
jgi:hypothetical protein